MSFLFGIFYVILQNEIKGRPDGGMVDKRDLKSLGHNGCAGSSPARATKKNHKWL